MSQNWFYSNLTTCYTAKSPYICGSFFFFCFFVCLIVKLYLSFFDNCIFSCLFSVCLNFSYKCSFKVTRNNTIWFRSDLTLCWSEWRRGVRVNPNLFLTQESVLLFSLALLILEGRPWRLLEAISMLNLRKNCA